MKHIMFPKDCLRIQKVLLHNHHIAATVEECFDLWEKYSNHPNRCACWMELPAGDDELFYAIEEILPEELQ